MMWVILVIRPFNHLLFRLSARQHEHVSNYFSRLSPHIVKSRGPIAKSPNPPRVPHPPTRCGPRLPRARVRCDCSSPSIPPLPTEKTKGSCQAHATIPHEQIAPPPHPHTLPPTSARRGRAAGDGAGGGGRRGGVAAAGGPAQAGGQRLVQEGAPQRRHRRLHRGKA
jgi:hypothetical protein